MCVSCGSMSCRARKHPPQCSTTQTSARGQWQWAVVVVGEEKGGEDLNWAQYIRDRRQQMNRDAMEGGAGGFNDNTAVEFKSQR